MYMKVKYIFGRYKSKIHFEMVFSPIIILLFKFSELWSAVIYDFGNIIKQNID